MKMKIWVVLLFVISILFLAAFHLFALMNLYPIYISSPLLFIAIYLVVSIPSHKKTFRGFK
ncbi:hypothetical protein LC065_18850 [Halobacillus litoralis]|uniref:hypothetical protein n=1 Tax=Halobacillus litoralis TaxID=45668 RepID=UPI001CFD5D19|nr:hypothetical protein [Halobacillus litoralis]WLR47535.1 hypothetical protein LC065_18850 [Halobacillus litoralis]